LGELVIKRWKRRIGKNRGVDDIKVTGRTKGYSIFMTFTGALDPLALRAIE
jgi:hypothetical protein